MASLSPNIAIRWFKKTDTEQVYQLSRQFGGEDFWEYKDFFALHSRINQGCLIAFNKEDRLLLGFLVFAYRPTDKRILHFAIGDVGSSCSAAVAASLLEAVRRAGLDIKNRNKPLSIVVRESDLAKQLFLSKALGFRCERSNPKGFDCPPEAGYLFVKRGG